MRMMQRQKQWFMKWTAAMVAVVMMLGMCSGSSFKNMFLQLEASAISPQMETAVQWAIDIANDDSHGYSQANRNGPDYDCSSLVSYALSYAGIYSGSAFTTATMPNILPKYGFTYISWSQIGSVSNLQRGDILWRNGHTEIYIGNNQNVGAHSDRGYPQPGDQTGTEVSVGSFYGSWSGIFRYGNVIPSSSLSVTAGTSLTDTIFSWNKVDGASYNLKIWNGTYWDGDAYYSEWGITGDSFRVTLPSGYYEAYIDLCIDDSVQMSNVVSFTVKDETYLTVNAGLSTTETVFSWNAVPNATRYDLKIWNGTYWEGDAYHIEWDVKGTSFSMIFPEGHYEGYLDTIVNGDIVMSNVVSFDVNGGTPLSVVPGYSTSETVFLWNDVPNATRYDIKIWNGTYWVGDAYHIEWDVKDTSFSMIFPEGHYEAYLDTVIDGNVIMSNVVTFDVKSGTPLNVMPGYSTSETVFSWNNVPNATRYDLKIWNGTYWIGDTYHIEWDIKDTSFSMVFPEGHYEAYLDTVVNGNVVMSNVVTFDIRDGTPLKVEPGDSLSKTVFSWNDVPNATRYDLKIWNGTYWEGDTYHIEWDIKDTSFSMVFPEGHYEAYLDTVVDGNVVMSNVVTFDIEKSASVPGDLNSDSTLTTADAVLLQKYLLNQATLTEAQYNLADLNADGAVNGFDLALLRQKLLA